jgi:hypothetical protein
LLDGADRGAYLAVLRSHDEPIALQLLGATWPDEKGDIRATLQQLAAEKAAERTGPEDQKSHFNPPLLTTL